MQCGDSQVTGESGEWCLGVGESVRARASRGGGVLLGSNCMALRRAVIEVERRFSVTEQALAAIARLVDLRVAEMRPPVVFSDTYFDVPGCELVRRDVWLRRRDHDDPQGASEWVCKVPHDAPGGRVYEELCGLDAARAWIDCTLPLGQSRTLQPLASVHTSRSAWLARTGGASISLVVDAARVGGAAGDDRVRCIAYDVGEIEVLVSDHQATAAALHALHAFAHEHGLALMTDVPPKILVALALTRPTLLAQLAGSGATTQRMAELAMEVVARSAGRAPSAAGVASG